MKTPNGRNCETSRGQCEHLKTRDKFCTKYKQPLKLGIELIGGREALVFRKCETCALTEQKEPVRRCCKCKKLKPETHEHYNTDKRAAGGLDVYCRECRKVIYQEYKARKLRVKNASV